METIITLALKSVAVLAIFVLVYHFLLRRLTFFHTNRAFLLLGIIASVTFPFIEITQTVYIERPVENIVISQPLMTPMAMVLESQPQVEPFDYAQLLMYLYLAVVLFFIGKMVVELSSLFRLIRSGAIEKKDGFVMVTLSRKLTPFSFFKYICYSAHDKNNADLPLIIDHEKVHAREWHSIDLLISHLYRAVFWINPLAWLLKRQIGENLEFIADAQAKSQHNESVNYERALLSSAASHMQPALANNFFTPFIKERIAMLQKEASATWNAYKYALILPVMVLFIYSFNVVEEVEFVDVPAEDQKLEENQNQTEHQVDPLISDSTLSKNSDTEESQKEVTKTSSYGVYDITTATTGSDLVKYASEINSRRSYQIQFNNIKENNGKLSQFEVWTEFDGETSNHKMTLELGENDLYLLRDLDDKMLLNNDASTETFYFTSKGVILEKEDWTYGDMKTINTLPQERFNLENNSFTNGRVTFKIVKTTTDKSLKEFKQQLKNAYDVDFKWSGLKRKNGVITAIKIQLDDNNGSVMKKSQKNSIGIDDLCIHGDLSESQNSWSLNNCDKDSYAAIGFMTNDFRLDSIRDIIDIQNLNMDTIHLNMMTGFKEINIDSIINQSITTIHDINTDSLIQSHDFSIENIESLKNDTLNKSTLIILNNVDPSRETLYSNNAQKFQPLLIVNGVISNFKIEDFSDSEMIESVTVLKGDEATALYGEKGNNGVVMIVTKAGTTLDKEAVLKEREEVLQERRDAIEELREVKSEKRKAILEERRATLEKLRDSKIKEREALIEQRSHVKEQRRAQLEQRRNLTIQQSNQVLSDKELANRVGDKGIHIEKFDRESILKAIGDEEKGYLYYDNATYFFVVENDKLNVFDRWGNYIDLNDKAIFYNSIGDEKAYVIVNGEKLVFEKDEIRRGNRMYINRGDGKFLEKIAGQPTKYYEGIDMSTASDYVKQKSTTSINKLSKFADSLLDSRAKTSIAATVKETNEAIFATNDMSKEGFVKLEQQLEKAGHSFKLVTHFMKSGTLKSLKFKINNSTSAMEANKGVKSVRISFRDGTDTPIVIMESN